MKLRNKKTGEIVEPCGINLINGRAFVRFDDEKGTFKFEAHSLAELNAEWEDITEEPKEYWYIDIDGGIMSDNVEDDTVKVMREIGNYFGTREQAEQAVEKLKAWKRLKDKGFRFTGIAGISNNIFVSFETDSKYSGGHIMYDEYSNTDNKLKEYNEDLTLLFGGEE